MKVFFEMISKIVTFFYPQNITFLRKICVMRIVNAFSSRFYVAIVSYRPESSESLPENLKLILKFCFMVHSGGFAFMSGLWRASSNDDSSFASVGRNWGWYMKRDM